MQVEMSERAAAMLQEYIDNRFGFVQCSSCPKIITHDEIADTNGGDNVICQACFDGWHRES